MMHDQECISNLTNITKKDFAKIHWKITLVNNFQELAQKVDLSMFGYNDKTIWNQEVF